MIIGLKTSLSLNPSLIHLSSEVERCPFICQLCLHLLIAAEWAVNDAFMVTLSAGSAHFDLSLSNLHSVCSLSFFSQTEARCALSTPGGLSRSGCRVSFYFDRISVRPSITWSAVIQAIEEAEFHNTKAKEKIFLSAWKATMTDRRAQCILQNKSMCCRCFSISQAHSSQSKPHHLEVKL